MHSAEENRSEPRDEITHLLGQFSNGDSGALDRLIPLIYDDLRGIAHVRLQSERADHTLNTTAVVHEAYVRLVNQSTASWRDRAHFFAVAATVMRRLLIDHARARKAVKRGGSGIQVPLGNQIAGDQPISFDVLEVDEALSKLARYDRTLVQLVECRFFGGMTMPETAEALGMPLRTVEREWTRAKAYLYQALGGGAA